jgi:hypothetical protein
VQKDTRHQAQAHAVEEACDQLMTPLVEEEETLDPVDIGTFSAKALVFDANAVVREIEELRLVPHRTLAV